MAESIIIGAGSFRYSLFHKNIMLSPTAEDLLTQTSDLTKDKKAINLNVNLLKPPDDIIDQVSFS
jgi:hypothetical protein